MRTPLFRVANSLWPCLCLLFGSIGGSIAQTNTAPQILFLHLAVKNETVSLLSTNARPGVLKPAPAEAVDDLHFEVLSSTGQNLWHGAVPDPLVRHLESEDPQQPNHLRRKTIRFPDSEFTIRVPLLPGMHRIQFYRLEPVAQATPGAHPVRKPLNSVPLVPETGRAR